LQIPELLFDTLGVDWVNQAGLIKGARKDGIMYENWGKKSEKFFHPFPLWACAIHYVPDLVSNLVLNSGFFEVVEGKVENPEEEIDADFIVDCRGRHNRNLDEYDELINPLNSVVLAKVNSPDPDLNYTRCVATPDGWTFVIPLHDSVSYGYLYNNKFIDKEKASQQLKEMFGVDSDGDLTFSNYVTKNFFSGERTILNGNRAGFLEPLEASSVGYYLRIAKWGWDHFIGGASKEEVNKLARDEMYRLEQFILWHYQCGSKFDTPFWDYAKSLPFTPDGEFQAIMKYAKESTKYFDWSVEYSQWTAGSYQNWIKNTEDY
jgi:tryptophan halogenase